MVKITCPDQKKTEVYEWFMKANKEDMTSRAYPDGLYKITKAQFGFLVDSIDGEVFEWMRDLPDPFMIFSALKSSFPFLGIEGRVSYIDYDSDIDYSEKLFSDPSSTEIRFEPIDED